MICRIPKGKISKIDIVNVKGGITATQVYNKYKPDYIVNLALYDMATGINITHLKDEGIISGYLFSEYGIGIKGDNEIVACHKDNNSIRDFVSGSPTLVESGTISIDWGNKVSTQIQGARNRTAIGFNGNELILYASMDLMTIEKLAQKMLDYGCEYAINCDGGGSSHLQEGNKVLRKSSRANASWLLVYLKEETKMPKICIDAGHGKETAGKRSPDGTLLEYEFNRDVAGRLKTILERHGVQVLLSAPTDKDIALTDRCKIANNAKVDYFISIHANAHKEYWTDANGWEIFIYGKGGKAEQLANKIQKHSITDLKLKNRGVKVDPTLTVLKGTTMPAVLIEHGFYTNKTEVEKLKDSTFRQKCAEADAKGILEHLGIKYIEKVPNEHEPSEWAKTAWEWAIKNKICDGTNPRGTITREQVVQMIYNFMNK